MKEFLSYPRLILNFHLAVHLIPAWHYSDKFVGRPNRTMIEMYFLCFNLTYIWDKNDAKE